MGLFKLLRLLAYHSRPTNGGGTRPRRPAAIQTLTASPPATNAKPAGRRP